MNTLPQLTEQEKTLKSELQNYKDSVERMALQLSKHTSIESEADRIEANAALHSAKTLLKTIDQIRLSYTRQLDDYKKGIMAFQEEITKSLSLAVKQTSEACDTYVKKQAIQTLRQRKMIEEERLAKLSQIQSHPESLQDIERMEVEFEAQAKAQSITTPTGIRTTYHAIKDPGTRWDEIVAFYMENGGDESKFDFLLDFLAKKGRPEIEGITYVPNVRNVSR